MKFKHHHVAEFVPGHYHVIAPNGLPVYDDAPYGNDAPIVFQDPDRAADFADALDDETCADRD